MNRLCKYETENASTRTLGVLSGVAVRQSCLVCTFISSQCTRSANSLARLASSVQVSQKAREKAKKIHFLSR